MFNKHVNPSVSEKSDSVNTREIQSTGLSQSGTHESDNHVPFAVEVESFNINTKTPEKAEKIRKNPVLAKHSSKIIAPMKNTKKGLPNVDVDQLECSCDGVPMLPIKLGCYNYIEINTSETEICRKAGRESCTRNAEGTVVGCTIVKTKDAFAIPITPKKDGNSRLQWVMNRIDLVKKVKGADGLVYVDIKVIDDLGEKVIRVPRTVFEENSISSLSKYNISVFSDHTMPMAVYFKKLLEEMPMEDASQVLGVVKNPSTNEVEFNGYGANSFFKTKSKYKTYKEYLEHFNPLLEQSKPLQYLLAATMAAPVLAVLQQKYNYDLHSYCINMVGASSTGKTICSRVCASAWTNPTDVIIFSSMNSTHNSAVQRLSGRYGVPTFYDEATNGGDVKADKYAYSIYNGRDKERLNRDGTKKASGTWSTIVCMSSEQHFHDNAKNQNGGLANRVHSMDNLSWTASKQHAEALNNFIKNNYGVLGKFFTRHLFKEDKLNEIEGRYAEAKETMNAYCENSYGCFTDRLCQTYALTYMTAVMLKEMGLAVDTEAVADIMAAHNAMVSEEQNLAKCVQCNRVIRHLQQQV